MTDIKSAIAILKAEYQHHPECSIMGESLDTAIRSLQSWEEVLQELEEERDRFNRCNLKGEVIGIVSAIEVIKQKLAKIEE